MARRKIASEQTRARVISAARDLLVASEAFTGFTVEAVARRAGVARLTVYYQFGSKAGLLEALCDSLAIGGAMEQIGGILQTTDGFASLDRLVDLLVRLWETDRALIRRLHGLAALDPDFARVIDSRQARRREGLRALLEKFGDRKLRENRESLDQAVGVLNTLISFETFDGLAGPDRRFENVAPIVKRLVRAALEPEEGATPLRHPERREWKAE
jgi:AcrR family transcriptional regulator